MGVTKCGKSIINLASILAFCIIAQPILGQESYFIVPFVPLHQLFGVFSWILFIYVIHLLATIPSMETAILRNIIQRTSYVLK